MNNKLYTKEELENMLEDVVNELDLSESAIAKHGPMGAPPAELVRLVLDQKDCEIRTLKAVIISLSEPIAHVPPLSGIRSVDLCLRMMIRAFYDEVRDRQGSEVRALLRTWFSPDEIEAASELIRKGVIPPAIDLSFYEQIALDTH